MIKYVDTVNQEISMLMYEKSMFLLYYVINYCTCFTHYYTKLPFLLLKFKKKTKVLLRTGKQLF